MPTFVSVSRSQPQFISSGLAPNLPDFALSRPTQSEASEVNGAQRNQATTRKDLEARVGIEPTDKGFADLSLTTWVPRPLL